MADGVLPPVPLYDDVTTFVPAAQMASAVRGICGGFPCQVPSLAIISRQDLVNQGRVQSWTGIRQT